MASGDEVEEKEYMKSLKKELTTKYHYINIKDEAFTCAQELVNGPLSDAFTAETFEGKLRQLLIEACDLTVSRMHENLDVKELEHIHYKLQRHLVESAELVKETDLHSKEWVRRLEQELFALELDLALFLGRLSDSNSALPQFVQKLETSCCKLFQALETEDLCEISGYLAEFLNSIVEIFQLIHHKYSHIMAVDCPQIEKAASRVTGVPVPRLPTNVVNRHPKVARLKLEAMSVDQYRVIGDIINSFANLNGEKNWERSLRRKFLFLGPTGVGKTQLAKAIALHFYGGLDRLIEVDTSVLTESALPSLFDDIAARPYDVILFRNIEQAKPVILENISDILSRGFGVGYSNTIIMTSSVGSEKLSGSAEGSFQRVVDEARKFFKPDFVDLMDGMFVFWKLFSPITVARLLIRDWAVSVNGRSIVVYPSAGISSVLHDTGIDNGREIKKWLTENVFPTVSEMVAECNSDETCAVYVDTLVGSTELSFRLDSCLGNLVENWYVGLNGKSLRELMTIYRAEREVINLSLKLEGICFELKDRLSTGMFSKAVPMDVHINEVAALISPLKELLLLYQNALASMCQRPNVETMPVAAGISMNFQEEVVKERVQFLKNKLQDYEKGQNVAVDIIRKSILRSMSKPTHPRSRPSGVYLLLGFDNAGKSKLKEEIAELLVGVQGVKPLLHVDFADESSSQSLLFSTPCKRNGRESDPSVIEVVKRWPYCVLVFDNIDKVNSLVYSNLIRVIDRGILHYNDGPIVDFRSTTIVLISNLGNKQRIARMFRRCCQNIGSEEAFKQGDSRFRSELLNRLDDVIFSVPATRESLEPENQISFDTRLGQSTEMVSLGGSGYNKVPYLRQAVLREVFSGGTIPRAVKITNGGTW